MKIYAHYGFKEFVLALGYKGELLKKYIVDYLSLDGNISVNFRTGKIVNKDLAGLDWMVDLVDTGIDTMTGGRIKRLAPYLSQGTFMMTWGDGVADIDIDQLLSFHNSHGKLATVTAVRPPARYGHLVFDGDQVVDFTEKPQIGEGWINGAFFVLEPGVFDYIEGDETQWEREPMEGLARNGQLMAYRHESFWQCMDTLREKHILEMMWQSGKAPWKIWE
jgi:glucose-1-phosphate cytidylyltransferase